LLDICTDHGGTEGEITSLEVSIKANSVPFLFSEDTNATPEDLLTNKLDLLHSDPAHNDVVANQKTFERFPQTSCLQIR